MKSLLLTGAALALSLAAAAPAAAQVNGIGITDPATSIVSTEALAAAYGEITNANQQQITQLQQIQQQRQDLMRQFDSDQNGELSDAEITAAQANASAVQQLQTLNQTIAQTQRPITTAQVYAVEQLAMQYGPALQKVMADKGVKLLIKPGAVDFPPPEAVLTDEVTAELDRLVPSVSTTVPEGWQPQQQSVALWEEVQQIIAQIAALRQAQGQQQPAAAAPTQPVPGR
ncbi:MAG TPA: OmpH family outer membrane protein [Croceibacterium sp.]|nr:OmpH family outer membrane protein [Croceibacterium sp.]